MNETEIKWRKQLLKSLANITDHTSSEYEIISNGVKTISFLEQENKQLKDNWNKLKKWLKKELGDRINPNKDKWLTGVYDAYREAIDKMQELERK